MSRTLEQSRGRARKMEVFYLCHIPFLCAALLLGFESFTKISLLYTTVVSAITASATYGAKVKAQDAQKAAES